MSSQGTKRKDATLAGEGSNKKAKHSNADGSHAAASASGNTAAAASTSVDSVDQSSNMEDVIAGSRKKRHSNKNRKRISKHILEAQARKAGKAEGSSADGKSEDKAEGEGEDNEADAEQEPSKENAAAAPAKAPKPAKAAPAAAKAPPPPPTAPSIESRVFALDYLRSWSSDRANWKFQKVRQVWLLEHLYDKESIPKKEFAIMIEYMKDLKGAARTRCMEEARKLVEDYAAFKEARAAAAEKEEEKPEEKEGDEEDEQKKRKRKAQRAEKILELLA